MAFSFVESNILFEFGSRWTTVLKWDRESAHIDGMAHVNQGKDVDFVGLLEEQILFFIEVRDYREHTRSAERGPMGPEFELKVRSTVAALVGAHRCRRYLHCEPLFDALVNPALHIRLVLWVEEPLESSMAKTILHKRRKAWAVADPLRLKRDVAWLEVDTMQASSFDDYEHVVPDLRVTRLAPERRQKAEAVIEILKRRGKYPRDNIRWIILDTVDMALLDGWLQRAHSVADARQLLRPR